MDRCQCTRKACCLLHFLAPYGNPGEFASLRHFLLEVDIDARDESGCAALDSLDDVDDDFIAVFGAILNEMKEQNEAEEGGESTKNHDTAHAEQYK